MHIQASINNIHLTEEPSVLAAQCKSKFKDTFTKAVEVFVNQVLSDKPSSEDSFILSTSIGNSENIVKLINEYRSNKFVSAQLFPEATMSSASVNINRLFGLKGGNITANPNLVLNDAILMGLLDSACNMRATHLIYGEVNDFTGDLKTHNYLIYIKIIHVNTGSYINLRGSKQTINPMEYDDLSIQLKTMMSPKLYQLTTISNTRGEVANVYLKRQMAHA